MDNYIIYNDELYHYGVPGMKWGVRKAARNKTLAAKKRYKKTLSTAVDEKTIRSAREKYKKEKADIKAKARKEIAQIEFEKEANTPAAVKAGKKTVSAFLKSSGTVALSALTVSAAVGDMWVHALSGGKQGLLDVVINGWND